MKLRSFRLRILAWSLGSSLLALLAFGLAAWGLSNRSGLRGVDQRLESLSQQILSSGAEPGGGAPWRRIDRARQALADQPGFAALALRVRDRRGDEHYRSENWPADLEARDWRQFLGSDEEAAALPPAPSREMPEPREFRLDAPREGPPPERPLELTPLRFETRRAGGARWRLALVGNRQITLALAQSLEEFDRRMRATALGLGAAGLAALALIAGGALLVARRIDAPLRRLSETAEAVGAGGLDQRIDPGQSDAEFARLIGVFNTMLDRIEASLLLARRFSGDAAHELKTPLTILQGQLESALQAHGDAPELQAELGGLLEETHRLKTIVEKLLFLSRADAGRLDLRREPLDLSAMARELAEDAEALAGGLRLRARVEPGIVLPADRVLLGQAFQNLVTNALKYSREGGAVGLTLHAEDGRAHFVVSNTGAGIPQDAAARVFDRFYRVDKARSRAAGGSGLGLSLAREIVRAHGGELELDSPGPPETIFRISLPLGKGD